ncbi:L-ascorbate metabolism protein UlaG (beta-lactamase superfamily) [Aurantimicrobium minutum]|uniref:MBL fold metallo-hydrolase n=1 Tax=Aurantimicrobium minutum TaxID=708131 RepID=UPI002472F5AF|nr:MBL fold metallo-hydrolase [Aurantimicrobium minutum]MDH6255093.1 L-ascorbate metabolism protein UlaG (beta-lactamase superfamily) [Aurantimicrobium minutum]MDH6409918.1 L-ascorbate metabolism protein UlaG (beta-lactamase superfamily) [Aurantimicrobium minutum]MDH6424113.1 L-ascorbate metabolism protein UlaG (beta-lactamase superfamily) [Aurantimicrobium minutum]
MKIRQIRNATLVLEIGGTKLLVDPWLAPASDKFPGPTAPLNVPMNEIVNVDGVILTHIHPDHWDTVAVENLDADIPIFTQHAADRDRVREGSAQIIEPTGEVWYTNVEGKNFNNVGVLTGNPEFKGVKLKKVPGQHGSDFALQVAYDILGDVMGVVLSHPKEKTLYIAGDTVWNEYVEANIAEYKPDVIIVNAGNAKLPGIDDGIIMSPEDVETVCKVAPNAVVIASHMEAVSHATTSRAELREYLEKVGLSDRVLIPADGETISL